MVCESCRNCCEFGVFFVGVLVGVVGLWVEVFVVVLVVFVDFVSVM